MTEIISKVSSTLKEKKVDPNIDKFDSDKAKMLYVLITRISKTVCFVATLILLPSILIDFIVEYILFG